MTINMGKVGLTAALSAGTIASSALGIHAGTKLMKSMSKATGKPVGINGSTAHIMTNDKIEDKYACSKEIVKSATKDTVKTLAATTAVGSLGYLATAKIPTVKNFVTGTISKAGNLLNKVSVEGKGTLKQIVQNSKIYSKFSALPTPVKAAVLAAGSLLTVIAPIKALKTAADSAAIEAKYEKNV